MRHFKGVKKVNDDYKFLLILKKIWELGTRKSSFSYCGRLTQNVLLTWNCQLNTKL